MNRQKGKNNYNPYKGLEPLFTDMFSKECNCCGKVYSDISSFITLTFPVASGSGLQETEDEEGIIVELFRTCSCGSTLMMECRDRRDRSPCGQKRRRDYELFIIPG